MTIAPPRFSPVWGWGLAGGLTFPALTLALGYLPTSDLVALATVVAGTGIVGGAALASHGRGDAVRESARAWAIAYVAGMLVYLTGLELPWPQPDTEVIVTADGSTGMNGGQVIRLVLFSIGVTAILGAARDGAGRAAPGKRLLGGAASAAVWMLAILPLPILMVLSIYATSIVGDAIGFAGEVPAHLVGLVCSGMLSGAVVGGTAEAVLRRLTSSPFRPAVSLVRQQFHAPVPR